MGIQLNRFQQDSNSDAIYVLISCWLLWGEQVGGRWERKQRGLFNQEIIVLQVRDDDSLGWRGPAEMERGEM